MFAIIPLIVFGLIYRIVGNFGKTGDWRKNFLLSAVVWGILVVINTEIFSLLRCLNFACVLGFWLTVLGIGLILSLIVPSKPVELPRTVGPRDPLKGAFLFFLFAIPSLLAMTAWMGPPNNWDSLVYHMSRVAHWIQDQTVAHYPTSIKKQIYYPPWAGYAILQFQILSGSDRLANFIQWFGMVGSMIAVSLISRLWGGSPRYQMFSAFLALTVPMGLLQAVTTQNDYVTAFWLTCFVYFFLEVRRQKNWENDLAMGASLGLAILTKPTAYLYASPFLVWLLIEELRSRNKAGFFRLLICGLIAFSLNIAYFWRNWSAAGSIIGEFATSESTRNQAMNIFLWFSNIIRNIGLHIGTSIRELNTQLDNLMYTIHRAFNIDAADPRTTIGGHQFHVPISLHEDAAGNFCHFVLIVAATAIIMRSWKKIADSGVRGYFLCIWAGFALFAFVLKWQPYGSRLHLPAFVLWAPLISLAVEQWQKKKTVALAVIMVVLITSAAPYTFRNSIRKLYSKKKSTVFNTPRIKQYFMNDMTYFEPYRVAVQYVQDQGCSQVGLLLDNNVWEYPFWALMREKFLNQFRLEHVNVPGEIVFPYPLGPFHPCAIIEKRGARKSLTLNFEGETFVKRWEQLPLRVFLPQPDVP